MLMGVLALACVPLAICNEQPRSVPVMVQAATLDTSGISANLAYTGPVALGNTLFVAIRGGNHTAHNYTITDTQENVFTEAGRLEATLDTVSLILYSAEAKATGSNTVSVVDLTSPGTLRIAVLEYSPLGVVAGVVVSGEGTSGVASVVVPVGGDEMAVTLITTSETATGTSGAGGTLRANVGDKLFVVDGSSTLSISPAQAWGALSLVYRSPCSSPTPTITFTAPTDADLAGHSLWYRELGGVFQKLVDWPCTIEEGGAKVCRGGNFDAPLQRYCPQCLPLQQYEFTVTAWDDLMNESAQDGVVSVCFHQVCVAPGPCN